MKFTKSPQLVYIDFEYLKALSKADPEIWFNNTEEYRNKPHLGILISENKREYVIPLTSAKEKHRTWEDVTSSWYRIYEIVDIREYIKRDNDILVNIVNHDLLKSIPSNDQLFYKQKILSILDLRKMFPVNPLVYRIIPMQIHSGMSIRDINKINLLMKEYMFIISRREEIEIKCTKIYEKQINKNKVLKYHCNYKLLETVCDQYVRQYS